MKLSNWSLPRHRKDGEADDRKATWLELFYDLIYVALIIQLSHHLFQHFNFQGMAYFLVQFTAIWIVWILTTYYNNRFESNDLRHTFFSYLKMLPMLGIAWTTRHFNHVSAQVFVVCYLSTRLILLYMWHTAGNSDLGTQPYINKYNFGNLVSMTLWLFSLYVPYEYMVICWLLAEVVDLLIPIFKLRIFEAMPPINHAHITERFALLMMIVFGEGIISMIRAFGELEILTVRSTILGIVGFTIVFIIYRVYIKHITKRSFGANALKMYFWWVLHLPLMATLILFSSNWSKIMLNSHCALQTAILISMILLLVIAVLMYLIKKVAHESD